MLESRPNNSPYYYYDHACLSNPYDKRHSFMLHSHNTYELLFFERGDAVYVIEDRKYHLKKNDLIFIRPRMYHYIDLQSNAEYMRINIAFDTSFVGKELLHSIPSSVEVINCPKGSVIAENFRRMDYYRENLPKEDFASVLSSLLREIFYNIKLSKETVSSLPSMMSPLLTRAIEYINSNLYTIKSIEEISSELFITEAYFFKIFKDQLKISPKKYINSKRLLQAQKLIRRGKRPTDVYAECGFDTYVGFYKQYVKTFGYPPSKEETAHSMNLTK